MAAIVGSSCLPRTLGSPGGLGRVALWADLAAVVGVTRQCHAAQRCPPWRESDAAPRQHRAVGLQLAAVRVAVIHRTQIPAHRT